MPAPEPCIRCAPTSRFFPSNPENLFLKAVFPFLQEKFSSFFQGETLQNPCRKQFFPFRFQKHCSFFFFPNQREFRPEKQILFPKIFFQCMLFLRAQAVLFQWGLRLHYFPKAPHCCTALRLRAIIPVQAAFPVPHVFFQKGFFLRLQTLFLLPQKNYCCRKFFQRSIRFLSKCLFCQSR